MTRNNRVIDRRTVLRAAGVALGGSLASGVGSASHEPLPCLDCREPHHIYSFDIEEATRESVSVSARFTQQCSEQTWPALFYIDGELVHEVPVTLGCWSSETVTFDYEPERRLRPGYHEFTLGVGDQWEEFGRGTTRSFDVSPSQGNGNGRGNMNGHGDTGSPTLHVRSGGPRILLTRSDQGPTTTVTIVSLDGNSRYTYDIEPGETINKDSMTGVRSTWYRVESYHPKGVELITDEPIPVDPTKGPPLEVVDPL